MKFVDWQKAKGAYIQTTGYQPDHSVIHPDDAKELIDTAGPNARLVEQVVNGKKVKTHAMIDGVPTLMDESHPKGQVKFENRPRMVYEPPPAYQKPRKVRR